MSTTATTKAEEQAALAAASAEKLKAKLPKAVRDKAEVVGGEKPYALLKFGGRTVASVRPKNVRVTFGYDSVESLTALAPVLAEAARSRPEVQRKEKAEDDE